MFERYTEDARRAVLNARRVANQCGSRFIEREHLLLGIVLAKEKAPAIQIDGGRVFVQSLGDEVTAEIADNEAITEESELPLSEDCRQILVLAAEEAKHLECKRIEPMHFFLGILRLRGL